MALVALVLMLLVLPSGMSRSAWLAALVASGYVWAMHHRYRLYRYRKMFWVVGVLLVLSGIGAYHWKKDSADGRLLMWKVATLAVLEHPWHGVGWENVAGAYGDAQEKYFTSGMATEQEEHVAGAPEYVFNEYLQVAMAWGVPALCGVLLVVGGCFYLGHRGRMFGVCLALVILSFAGCVDNNRDMVLGEMPQDTSLEFWITEDVEGYDWLGYDEIYGWFGAREFLGKGYKRNTDSDDSMQYPEHYVSYVITAWPDYADGGEYVTDISITDPAVAVYGLTVESTFEEFDAVFGKMGCELSWSDGAIKTRVAKKNGITFSLTRAAEGNPEITPQFRISAEISNREGIIY